jgi:hypothetical protein
VVNCIAQPILVNTSPYADVRATSFDSINKKIYFNLIQGCQFWNIPCALNYISAKNNLTNKHSFFDNTVSTVQNSNFQIGPPMFGVNNVSSTEPRQSLLHENSIYTNYGYYFNKIDTTNLTTIWSYSPATNPSYKEISTFQIKNDSVFFFEKDSISTKNYYNLFVKNKFTGNTILYNSLNAANPSSGLGAIEGYINSSVLINNSIVLAGVFTASISGTYVARNLVSINLATGQLQAPPVSFPPGSSIYDMKLHNNKVYIGGKFTTVDIYGRNNYVVLDNNLNMLPDCIQFTGIMDPPNFTWVDKLIFYDDYLIVKGNFSAIDYVQYTVFQNNNYMVKVIEPDNYNQVLPWTINLSGGATPSDYMFDIHKNKLYIKNKQVNGSPFHIYCFEPVLKASNVLFPGSVLPNLSTSISICAPDDGNNNVFVAPIRYASGYNWTYSGANATIVPQTNPSTIKLIVNNLTTNGILSVTGINDCGLSTPAATLDVIIKQKPIFTLPTSPKVIICNPDSTLLLGITTNSNATIWWRKDLTNTISQQPFYAKTQGNYYMVTMDNSNGCVDSGMVIVNNYKLNPNAKITSHLYPGVLIPIDTVTCFKPIVNITAASDTSGVTVTWKSISTNSVYSNPLSISSQNNLKVIVTRNNNNCVDSSLIVLVGQNNLKPNVSVNSPTQELNCSYYTASLNAMYSPSNCSVLWSGAQNFTTTNNSTINSQGKYYVSVKNPINGCLKQDSVIVIQTNNLILKSTTDTVACKQSQVNLNSIRVGTISNITYTWSNGYQGNSISVTPTTTTNYIVYANGPGGCFGIDTIKVIIPTDIQDSIIAYRSCDNSQTGSIVMFAKGGIAPYKYSINNGSSFSSSNSFINLPYGNYYLMIKDSIGCLKTNSISLNSLSNLPTPKFLASTQNFKSDTIVLVDISLPRADSIHWFWPNTISLIGGNMFNPIITSLDTGAFQVTMKAFYGNCFINTTKLIRFNQPDSLHANYNNANGIKTCVLYPNPNTGQFMVQIEFYKKQNASIQVWDTSPNKYLQQNFYEVNFITLPVNLSQLQNGAYILRVIGEYDAKNKPFIINK